MNEQEIINQAARDKAALDSGEINPSRVQKTVRKPDGTVELVDVPPSVIVPATRLLKLRRQADMTQQEFAILLGVPLSTYRNYEQFITETPLSVLKLAAIAAKHPEMLKAV